MPAPSRFAVPVVDAQHRHRVIAAQAGQRRLDLFVGFPGGSGDHRVGPDEDAQPVVAVGEGALQQLHGRRGGVEVVGGEGGEPASGPAGDVRVDGRAQGEQLLAAVQRGPRPGAHRGLAVPGGGGEESLVPGWCGPVTHCREHVRSFRAGVSPRRGGW